MRISLITVLLLLTAVVFAQPANDNPCGAINIPVVENADGCSPQSYSIVNATYLNLTVPNACGNVNPDVWYSFTPVRSTIYISVTGAVQLQLYTATSCNGTFTQDASVNCFNGGEISFGITAGTLYYMRISNTANNGNFTFTTCATTKYPAASQRVGINTKIPQYNFDVKGRAYFTDSTEFLRSVKFYSGIEVNNALKLSLPFAANNKILASDASGNASWKDLALLPGQWQVSGNDIYSTANAIGMGTLTPQYKLDVVHAGDNGIRLKSTALGSFVNIDANDGNAQLVFSNNAAAKWVVRNKPDGTDDFQISQPGIGERFIINASNGNVGINYSSPDAKLTVGGNVKIADGSQGVGKVLTSDANGLAAWQNLPAGATSWSISGANIYNNNAGNVGIGTATPTGPLSFANTLGNKIVLWGDGSAANYGMGIQGGLLQIYSDAAASDIAFGYGRSNAFTERMRIKGNGNVGIGDANPGYLLSVNGTGQAIMRINGGTGMYVTLAENNLNRGYIGSFEGNPEDIQFGTHSQNTTGSLHLSTVNVPRLTVSAAGNVGIGNSSPSRPLSFPAAPGEKILLYPGGNGEVGIGVYNNELRIHADNPGAKISFGTQDNAGNFDQTALAQRNGVYAFSVLGSLWVNGTTYASDERFKKNITPIASPLTKLLLLDGVEYEMRTESFPANHFTAGRQIGLLAQNVEKVIPEAVNEKDGYKGVDYARLVPLLIESIKELKKEIEALKAHVNH